MIQVKQSKFKDLTFHQKQELERLVQLLPIQNYRQIVESKVHSVIYGMNDKQEIITCLFITKNNEIIFYRTKTSLQGRGFGSTILLLTIYAYKDLSICTSNEKVVDFCLKNNFIIAEKLVKNVYSGKLSTRLIKQ
jgi:hypothetical protein